MAVQPSFPLISVLPGRWGRGRGTNVGASADVHAALPSLDQVDEEDEEKKAKRKEEDEYLSTSGNKSAWSSAP